MNELNNSLAGLKGKKGVMIALIAVLLVPLIYAAIILTASWGPYDNLSNLPVAVVNEDKGAMSGDEAINVGNDLVADLKENKTLGWDFVGKKEAEDGMNQLKYYMLIEIPEDFSQKITTVLTENPSIPELKYIKNEGLHFMASQVTETATIKIREQLSNKITETYAKNMFAQLDKVAKGFQEGADGAAKLHEGSFALKDGTGQLLSSLQTKAGDISNLANGSQQVKDGTGQLLTALKGGAGDIKKLENGAKEISNGAASLEAGANQLLGGLKTAQAGSVKLNDGLAKLTPGSKAVADGVGALTAGAESIVTGSDQVTAGIEQLKAKLTPFFSASPELEPTLNKLLAGSKAVSTGASTLKTKSGELKAGAEQVAAGIGQAAPGAEALKSGIDKLMAGQVTVSQGAAKLATGASTLANGNAKLNDSWTKLTSSVATIDTGMIKISKGNQDVNNGWNALLEGVSKVDNGIVQVKNGSNELAGGLKTGSDQVSAIKVNDENIKMFAAPIQFSGDVINTFPMYRYANAPYVLSLALFIGVLALSLIFTIRKPENTEVSSVKWYGGLFAKMAGYAAIQAIMVSGFALFFIKTSFANGMLLVLFSVFASITFLAIVFFLVALAGHIGRFIAVAFVVLQLSTTGSSLPIEMLPENLRALSSFLPMRYSIESFKALISLDNSNAAWSSMMILGSYLLIFILLIGALALFQGKKTSTSSTLAA